MLFFLLKMGITNDNKLNFFFITWFLRVRLYFFVIIWKIKPFHVKSLKNIIAKDRFTNMMNIINRCRENHSVVLGLSMYKIGLDL